MGVNAPHYLWGIALGHIQAGDAESAQQKITEAFTHAERTRELRWNAELLILQAEIDPKRRQRDSNARAGRSSIADEEGAVATALRATAALALRSKGDEASRELRASTLDMLDGRSPYPEQRDWMQERLATLRRYTDATAMAQAHRWPRSVNGGPVHSHRLSRPAAISSALTMHGQPTRRMGGNRPTTARLPSHCSTAASSRGSLPGDFRLAQATDGGNTHPVIHLVGHQRDLMIVQGGVPQPTGLTTIRK